MLRRAGRSRSGLAGFFLFLLGLRGAPWERDQCGGSVGGRRTNGRAQVDTALEAIDATVEGRMTDAIVAILHRVPDLILLAEKIVLRRSRSR